MGASSSHISDPALRNCLFDAVTLSNNSNTDKYGYSGYGIGFDRRSSLSLIFGVDMSSSAHIDNKGRDTLVLGKGPIQGLKHT